jgi:hypothetical protein
MASNLNLFPLWRTLAFVRVCTHSSCGITFAKTDKIADPRKRPSRAYTRYRTSYLRWSCPRMRKGEILEGGQNRKKQERNEDLFTSSLTRFSEGSPRRAPHLIRLFLLPATRDSLVDGLSSGKAFFHAMPEFDLLFSILPAQQHNLIFHLAGKIQQPDINVFHLHSDRIDFRHCVLNGLLELVSLSSAANDLCYIWKKPATKKDSMLQVQKLLIDLVNRRLCLHRALKERFQDWQELLRFFQGECLRLGHNRFVSIPSGVRAHYYESRLRNPVCSCLTLSHKKMGFPRLRFGITETVTQPPASDPAPLATSASPRQAPGSDSRQRRPPGSPVPSKDAAEKCGTWSYTGSRNHPT